MGLIKDFFGLIFPMLCVGCDEVLLSSEKHLCLSCLADLPKMVQQASSNPVKRVFDGKVNLENATAFLEFEPGNKAQRIIHELKYKNNPQLAIYMGKLMGIEWKDFYKKSNIDAIIPVPLHYSKKIKRGYNQAEKLAIGIAEITGIDLHANVLKRHKKTESQTTKSRYDRWVNVASVFSMESRTTIFPEHVLLVDDVITTGATAEACARCLISHFGCKVTVVSLARAA